MRESGWRFWLPIGLLAVFAIHCSLTLFRAHVDPEVVSPKYAFTRELLAPRGSIYSAVAPDCPFAKSVPCWEYSLDPLALTNGVVRPRGELPRTRAAIIRTISDVLGLDYAKVTAMANNNTKRRWRDQFLAESYDANTFNALSNSKLVRGVAIKEKQVRRYFYGRHLAHVLGSVNAENVGSAGLEQRYNRELTGIPGQIQGMRDGSQQRRELYDRRKISIDPIPGSDIYLTIHPSIQFNVDDTLKWGIREYGAGSGWALVMDARTGAILAMSSFPDFDPSAYGKLSKDDSAKINRTIAYNYEPGSVMKVITAAAAIDSNPNRYGPKTVFNTSRNDSRYYRLPGDGSHRWEPTMTLEHAIVHSSNIVIGKLAYDLGPNCLYDYFRRFGFGEKTGIELPGEETGLLADPKKRSWDLLTRSRVGIGQGVAVTAIQLASAYQAIANDGKRMKPYIIEKIVDAEGRETYSHEPVPAGRPISARTARILREMMLKVASKEGTARRAAIPGYTVAGKTGTAQKKIGRAYSSDLYRATFCGILPASEPRVVILVTLDFERKTLYHQGGNSAGPVFRRMAKGVTRYLDIPPDKADEYLDFEGEDEFDQILNERAEKYGIIREN